MTEKQRTIKTSAEFEGRGLHTGEPSKITFKPAPPNYGLKFVRTDLPEEFEIPALVDYVVDLSRGTTLGKDGVKVHTVEHVLGALAGLGVDNCRIELSGIEPPVGDGSSLQYAEALLEAGIEEQNEKRRYFSVDETIRFTDESRGVDIVALPNDDYRITVMIDYHNPALGSQHTGVFNLYDEFVREFAPARTFCFLTEVNELLEQNLIKGGQLDNAIVIQDMEMTDDELKNLGDRLGLEEPPKLGSGGILNDQTLRFKNEPARHKLLDMLGDLALAGVPIKAQILAARPGHRANWEFAKKIRAEYLKKKDEQRRVIGPDTGTVLNINDLMKFMPHRYPFLLVDKVVELDSENDIIVAIKNVTVNEPQFTGHFPEQPVMPGVLLIEALAQAGNILLLNKFEDIGTKLALFMGVKNAKFRKPVLPGDRLVMEMRITGKRFNAYFFKGAAYVDGKLAVEAELSTAIVERGA